VTKNPTTPRVMGASCGHGRVGAFYAPRAREGKQMLQHYTSKSVEAIRGHSILKGQ
jgi:hypothetical protein